MFISRVELLPEDETTNEHDEAKHEEAQQIETDKATGGQGLFKGAFIQPPHAGPHLLGALGAPIRDFEDNVDRCPLCAWELEDGECNHCGWNDDSGDDESDEDDDTRSLARPSIISINDSELDGEIDLEDRDLDVTDYEDDFVVNDRFQVYVPGRGIADVHQNGGSSDGYDDDEADSETSEAPRRLNVIRRIPDEDDEESDGEDTEVPDERRGTDLDISDDDDDDESMSHGSVETYGSLSESESESDFGRYEGPFNNRDETPSVAESGYGRYEGPFNRDETPSAGEPRSPGSFYADVMTTGDPGYGFSPAREASPNSTLHDHQRSPTPQRDSSVEVVRHRNRTGIPRRPARVVISSDEESDESTPTPPRSAGDRRAHLQGQRARRGGAGGTRTAQRHYRGR